MKKSIWAAFVILVIIAGGCIVSDVQKTKRVTTLVNQLQLSLNKVEQGNETEIGIKVLGELPSTPVMILTIFTDNRYLEFVPESWSDKEVVNYIGQTAGGAEANFEISRNFDGEMTVRYIQKEKATSNPLVYVHVESKIKRIILGDTVVRTENIRLN
ncbi:hypothetical protein [Brevibacillus centrosporus]|uniref:hypothetical protein n=1 Tax=Brevibacillus centrosporus TaxID=54910 RepID=UPI00382008FC